MRVRVLAPMQAAVPITHGVCSSPFSSGASTSGVAAAASVGWRPHGWRLCSHHDAASVGRRAMSGGLLGLGLAGVAGGRGGRAYAAQAKSEIEQVLVNPGWPDKFPLTDEAFARYDEGADSVFYSSPRFVTHIDDAAIGALTAYYAQVFPPSGRQDTALLDMCSSWISHYPKGYSAGRIAGTGMNGKELAKNPILTDYAVKDLNEDPGLPYPDACFDVVTNAVSVDYLARPLEVFQEIHRVLKPGGLAVMSFSNRCFPTKAVSIWTATGDPDHVWLVGAYFHYSVPGGFTPPEARDITPPPPLLGRTDPMYVVYARKASSGAAGGSA